MANKLALLGAALLLAACTRIEAPQPAPAATPASAPQAVAEAKKPVDPKVLRMMELLRAVYGGQGAQEAYMEVDMPDPEQRNEKGKYLLAPVAMQELPDGRMVVVADAELLGDDGEVMTGHSSPGFLSAYVLRKAGDKWQVEARHENIAALGSSGRFDEVQWVSLGEGKPGFVVMHGGVWMGQAIGSLSAFDLTDGAMHDLTDNGVSMFSNNDGDCGEDSTHCWSVEGKWQFEKREGSAYDDLVVRFTGHEEDKPENAPETQARKRKDVAGMARYKFDGGRYVLVEGENIVPGV
ncbi:hypothetical protein ACN9MZ_22835 [Pseudoduganella sp. S-14]|uniref:hypothetical protein n=1 Tax=Pseudoduganella sp. S-14 TaxID=3404065 RepID=UPI003CEFC022